MTKFRPRPLAAGRLPRYGRSSSVSDEKPERRPADPDRIDLEEPGEVRYWCSRLECSEAQLRAAVRAVGAKAADVRFFLKRR